MTIAVATNKLGYVFVINGRLQDWSTAVAPTKSTSHMVGFVQGLINDLRPDVLVTETRGERCRKGAVSQSLIQAIQELASHNAVLDVAIPRRQRFPSKYEEATALAERYPEIAGYLPKEKRRFFDYEPRNMILFEALALADDILNRSPEQMAMVMG